MNSIFLLLTLISINFAQETPQKPKYNLTKKDQERARQVYEQITGKPKKREREEIEGRKAVRFDPNLHGPEKPRWRR